MTDPMITEPFVIHDDLMGPLNELIAQARREGKWLKCNSAFHGYLWFSPSELEAENRNGKYRWGVVNWDLRDPFDRIEEFEQQILAVMEERNRFTKRMIKDYSKSLGVRPPTEFIR